MTTTPFSPTPTSPVDDGGPAYPLATTEETIDHHGMSLRDWFAGQALASIMQDKSIWDSGSLERHNIAARMYQWADALLTARKGGDRP